MVSIEAGESGRYLYPRSQLGNDRRIREIGLKSGFTEVEIKQLLKEGRECIRSSRKEKSFARLTLPRIRKG